MMERLPDYDNWKLEAPEDDTEAEDLDDEVDRQIDEAIIEKHEKGNQ